MTRYEPEREDAPEWQRELSEYEEWEQEMDAQFNEEMDDARD